MSIAYAHIIKSNIKGDVSNLKHICATMHGKITRIMVIKGDKVKKGDLLIVAEAMKIETKITSNISGMVYEVYLNEADNIEYGDLIVKLE